MSSVRCGYCKNEYKESLAKNGAGHWIDDFWFCSTCVDMSDTDKEELVESAKKSVNNNENETRILYQGKLDNL